MFKSQSFKIFFLSLIFISFQYKIVSALRSEFSHQSLNGAYSLHYSDRKWKKRCGFGRCSWFLAQDEKGRNLTEYFKLSNKAFQNKGPFNKLLFVVLKKNRSRCELNVKDLKLYINGSNLHSFESAALDVVRLDKVEESFQVIVLCGYRENLNLETR